jgi:hypothetical protein
MVANVGTSLLRLYPILQVHYLKWNHEQIIAFDPFSCLYFFML